MKPVVLMLTHIMNDHIREHFSRLKRESGYPCFLVHHRLDASPSDADVVLSDHDFAERFPNRVRIMKSRYEGIMSGYCDLPMFTAALDGRFVAYDTFWLIEYDVDFSGSWSDFFKLYDDHPADLIAAWVRTREQEPDWQPWSWTRQPENASLRFAFLPAIRLSRTLIETYAAEIESGNWGGHCEFTIPSIAKTAELAVKSFSEINASPFRSSQYAFRPVRFTQYFCENPTLFTSPNSLIHPVKATAP